MTKIQKLNKLLKDILGIHEMSNLLPRHTNLPTVIWISNKGNTKHGPRIKVNQEKTDKLDHKNLFSITIEDSPRVIGNIGKLKQKEISLIKEWILKNKETLLLFWKSEIDTFDVAKLLKPL